MKLLRKKRKPIEKRGPDDLPAAGTIAPRSWFADISLERGLQIAIATLSATGSVLLGMGEESVLLALVAVFMAAASVYVTDVKGWIRLSRTAGDVAGVVALVFAFIQYRREASDVGLLALVNFVVYVQFVLQFKPKRTGIYWLLILLSLVQVAVATALDVRLAFGVLLGLYVPLGMFALTLFYLYRESSRTQGDVSDAAARQSSPRLKARWPLDAQATRFAGSVVPRQADDLLSRRLVWQILRICGGAMLVSAVVFYAFPRSNRVQWQTNSEQQAPREVGFSSEVTLGQLGSVSESTEEVMQVWLTHPVTEQVYELDDLPLFRGVVLTRYENKKWSVSKRSSKPQWMQIHRERNSTPLVRGRYRVQPVKEGVLFSIFPSYATDIADGLHWDAVREQISREDVRGTTIDYELLTAGLSNRRMAKIVPAPRAPSEFELERLSALPPVSEAGVDPLAETKALTQSIVEDIPAEDHFARARALNNYLRDSTRFGYSLGPVPRDPTLDPVEEFVNRSRVGHCEYFASALALMLRSIGIPSRLAVGFKGGEWDEDHYNVRQMDAHAWVEAYLPPDQIPPGQLSEEDSENGAWIILDPTTANAPVAISTLEYLLQGAKQGVSMIRSAWNNYVLGMDYERQQNAIFRPIGSAVLGFMATVKERDTWIGVFAHMRSMISPTYWGLANGGWFSLRGAVAAMVIMLILAGGFTAGKMALDRWRAWQNKRSLGATSGGPEVEFYRRFETILSQHQLIRVPSQTPREFALAVGGQLAESPRTAPAAPLARQIVELFYRVRFGRRPLNGPEAEKVERALTELAGALANGNPRESRRAE